MVQLLFYNGFSIDSRLLSSCDPLFLKINLAFSFHGCTSPEPNCKNTKLVVIKIAADSQKTSRHSSMEF